MEEPRWLDYQKLAADIYADLEENATVTHDDRIRGVESGIDRQIDVSIKASVAGHDILIIVQAKDLARPADVNVVGEFQAVIEDVRAAKGVLICSGGFTETAIEYGGKLGIDLCTAHDAKHRKWGLDLRIPLLWIESSGDVSLQMLLVPDRTNSERITLERDPGKWLTSVDGGRSAVTIGELLATPLNQDEANRRAGGPHQLEVARAGMRVRLGESFWCPVQSIGCSYTVQRKGWRGTFTFAECRGIFNRGSGKRRAKVKLTEKDIPVERDKSWSQISDPDMVSNASESLLMIEKLFGPDSFVFSTVAMGLDRMPSDTLDAT